MQTAPRFNIIVSKPKLDEDLLQAFCHSNCHFPHYVESTSQTRRRNENQAKAIWGETGIGHEFQVTPDLTLKGSHFHILASSPKFYAELVKGRPVLESLTQRCAKLFWIRLHFGYMPAQCNSSQITLSLEEFQSLMAVCADYEVPLSVDEENWFIGLFDLPSILKIIQETHGRVYTSHVGLHLANMVDNALFKHNDIAGYRSVVETLARLQKQLYNTEHATNTLRECFCKFRVGQTLRLESLTDSSSFLNLEVLSIPMVNMGQITLDHKSCRATTEDGQAYQHAYMQLVPAEPDATQTATLNLDNQIYQVKVLSL